MNIVQGKDYRFTLISDKLCRLEYSESGKFEDRPTQFAQNRDWGQVSYIVTENTGEHLLEIETDYFKLCYDGGKFSPDSLYIDAKYNYGTYFSRWYFGEKNKKNLKGTVQTLDGIDGKIDLEDGIQSKDGYSYLDDTNSFVLENDEFLPRDHSEIDGYYFAYGRDYRGALKAYYKLAGKTPLLPRYALGNWWSRYYKYTQESYLALMERFEKEQIPVSVAVLDMDWHVVDIPARFGSGWTGYSWNKELFPQPEKLLHQLHVKGKHVTLNVHPAAGIRAFEDCYPTVAKYLGLDMMREEPANFDLSDHDFRQSYFSDVHHPLEKQGVDFWWIDWQQGPDRDPNKVEPLWALNHYHFIDKEKKTSGSGLILSRYAGPGSHRYPVGFSGDTVISWESLVFQPYFTATATNIGYTWWSHDIGGHFKGEYDPDLALRWLQLGVFSPINRLHSYDNPFVGKEPWNYPVQVERAMTKFLRLRARLLPYLDTANYQTSANAQALIEPLYYRYPNARAAYEYPNQYFFGSELMVAPITTPLVTQTGMSAVEVWLPEGQWYDFFTGIRYIGETKIKVWRDQETMPVFVKAGGIIPMTKDYMADPMKLPDTLEIRIFPGADGHYTLVEHVGDKIAQTSFNYDDTTEKLSYKVNDPASIIPSHRKIEIHQIGANQTQLLKTEIVKRLQFAKMDYEKKKEILRFLPNAWERPTKLVSYLGTLADEDISSMLLEMSCLI
ncbi:TIM-barrel domain-containing protein [Ligilactobacillus animalis]|jgi:alpha-glucosidase (family GH31 glycosyl hydrolase)|uniref:glycoside hydrolase family 31 protein n=1 Tax=Ligilactobacillus animalis TaxID=1605 RepID=UPI002593811E|nr:TIM-barrel domain-containing protein [Ligilactobacillus animalis]